MAGDPYAKRLLWFVFAGSKGGLNRMRLISAIRKMPLNANQLAKELGLDYKAIQHHVNVLEKNNLISRVGNKYGVLFFISTFLEVNLETFDEIVTKLEKGK
jgi:DNA-binding MarR family transcriptional regulator